MFIIFNHRDDFNVQHVGRRGFLNRHAGDLMYGLGRLIGTIIQISIGYGIGYGIVKVIEFIFGI